MSHGSSSFKRLTLSTELLAMLLMLAAGIRAADDAPTEAQVEAWARDLSSDDFDTRETAEKALENTGPAMLPVLRKQLQNKQVDLQPLQRIILKLREREFVSKLQRLQEPTWKFAAQLQKEKDEQCANVTKDIEHTSDHLLNMKLQSLGEETPELKDQIHEHETEVKSLYRADYEHTHEFDQKLEKANAASREIYNLCIDPLPPGLVDAIDPDKLDRWATDCMPIEVRLRSAVKIDLSDIPIESALKEIKYAWPELEWEHLQPMRISVGEHAGIPLGEALQSIARQAGAVLTIDKAHNSARIAPKEESAKEESPKLAE